MLHFFLAISLVSILALFGLGRKCGILKVIVWFYNTTNCLISKDKENCDSSWYDLFKWVSDRFNELCFGSRMCTWAILASSWSFLSLFSFSCMKSLSIVLCPCMLYSLLVKSIPLCSSFTSNKTLSRETEEYRERIHLLEII